MVVIKKLKRSTLEILSLSKIFGAAILFVMANISVRAEENISASSLKCVSKMCGTLKSRLSYLAVMLFFLLLSFRGAGQCTTPAAAGTIIGTQTVCQGQSAVSYSISSIANATSYIWSYSGTGATISNPNTNSISISLASNATSGNLTVKGTNSCGDGTISANYSINVNPLPVTAGTISGISTVCQGQSSVSYTIPAITNATNYTWAYSGTGATIVFGQGSNSILISFSSVATDGLLSVFGSNACGSGNPAALSVTVNPLPGVAGIIVGTSSVCQGASTVSFSVPAVTNASSYTWAYSGTGATITGTTNNVTISFAANATPGNLTVRGTNSCGNGAVSANYAIALSPLPDASSAIAGPPAATVCQGSAGLVYSVPAIANASSYVWSYSGTGATILGNTNSVVVNFSSTATSGNLIVLGRNACGDGVASPNYPVVVNPLPGAAGVISGTSNPCQGLTTVSYSVPGISDATSYVWSYSGTGATITGTSNNVTIDFAANATDGNITVFGRNSCGDGAISGNYPVTLNLLPAAAGTMSGLTLVCQGQTNVDYSVSPIAGAVSYVWSYSGTGYTITSGATTANITINFSNNASSGNLTVYGVDACGNGVVSANYAIVVNPLPVAPGIITGSAAVCQGQVGVAYSVPTITYALTYLWSYTGTGASISGTSRTPSINFSNTATSGYLTVRGVNSCGQGVLSADFLVSVNNSQTAPTVDAGASNSICEGTTFYTVPGATASNYSTLNWISSGTGSFINPTTINPTYFPSAADVAAGSVNLTLVGTAISPCTNSVVSSRTLTIQSKPISNAGPDSQVCRGSLFTTSSSTASNYSTTLWSSAGDGTFDIPGNIVTVYTPGANDIANGGVVLTLQANSVNPPCSGNVTSSFYLQIVPFATANAGSNASICSNGTYTVSGAAATNYSALTWTTTGSGTFSDIHVLSPIYTPSATDISVGNVTLTLTATPNLPCASPVSATMLLTINPTATVNAGPDGTVCQNGTFTTTGATSGHSSAILWRTNGTGTFNNSSLLQTVYSPSAEDVVAGSVILTVQATSLAPCVSTVEDFMVLTVTPLATVTAGPNGSTCGTTDFVITQSTQTNAASLAWTTSGTGTFSNSTQLKPTYTPSANDVSAGSVILTLTGTSGTACSSTSSSAMTLTIAAPVTANAGVDASVCEDGSYTLHGTAPNSVSVNWTSTGTSALANAGTLTPVFTPNAAEILAGSVTLTLHATGSSPCSNATSTVTLTILKKPVVYAGPNAGVCAGSNYPITLATAPNSASVAWSTTDGTGTFSNPNILLPVYFPSAADIAAGHVTLRLTAQPVSPCSGAVFNDFVLTFIAPATANAGPDDRICQSQTTYTIGGTSSNSSSVNWTTSGTGTFVSGTTLTPTYSPSLADIAAGSVTLTLHAAGTAPCADATDFMVLSIAHIPTVSAGAAANVCQGYPFTVSDATATDYTTLLWSHNGTGSLTNPTTLTPTYNPGTGESGAVTLTLTAGATSPCAGQVFATKIIAIQAAPTAYAGPDAQVCQPNTYTIIGATVANAGILNWSSSGSGTFTGNGTLTPTYHPSSADFSSGQVTLTLQANGLNSCSAPVTDIMLLRLISTPTAYAGIDAIICQGGSYAVSGAAVTNASSYSWTTSGSGTLSYPTSPLAPVYTAGAGETGSVTLTLTARPNSPCAADAVDQMIISIQSPPTANAGVDATTCEGNTFTLSGAVTNSASFAWTTTGSGSFTGISTTSPRYIPSVADAVAGSVTFTLTTVANSPCAANVSDAMTLTVVPKPVVNAGSDATICASGQYDLTTASTLATVSHTASSLWSTSGDGTFSNTGSLRPIYTPGTSDIANGQVRLTLTGQPNTNCSTPVSDFIILTIIGLPTADAGPASKSICKEGITLSVASATNYSSIGWVSSGTAGTLTNINTLSPTYVPSADDIAAGSVTLTLTVNGITPCSGHATDQIILTIQPVKPVISVLSGTTTFCEGGSVTLTGATAGYNYSWTPGGAATQNNVVTVSGSYRLVITDPVTGCSSLPSAAITVTVNEAPLPPTSIGYIKQCWNGVGTPATLDARNVTSVPGTATIVWYDAATVGNVVATPNWNTLGSITYYAEAVDNTTNCLSLTRTPVKLTIATNPTTPVKDTGSDITACETISGTTITASITTPAGITMNWYTTPTGGSPVSPTLSSVGTKTFYAEANNGTCASTSRSEGVVLTINPAPVPPVGGGDITECVTTPAQTLTATATVSAGTTLRWWTAPTGGTQVILPALPTLSALGTKTYHAESVNTLTNCTSLTRTAVTLSLVIHPAPPVADPDIVECQKNPLQVLTAKATVPTGSTVKWYTAAAGGSPVSPTLNAVGTLSYYAETDNGSCGSSTRTKITLTINPAPETPVSLGDITDCERSPIQTLVASSSDPAALWYTTPTGGSPVSPFLNAVGSATYYAESMLGTCPSITRSAGVVLTIKAIPEPPISQGDQRACEQSPMQTLTAVATPPPGSTVKWYLSPTGGVPITNPTINSVKAITYYAESDNGSCKSLTRTAVSLQIDAAPKPPVAGLNITECESIPNIQRLEATASFPSGSSINWFSTPTGGDPVSPILDMVGTATYYAESNNGSCTSVVRSAPVVLTINPTPASPVTINLTECPTKPLQVLTATTETPAADVTISWYNTLTGGTPVALPILKVVGTKIYYAESKLNKCVNPIRTADTLTITSIIPDPILKTKGMDSIYNCESTPIVPLYARDLFTPVAGKTIVCFDAATGGFEVPSKLDIAGSVTMYAAAKDIITGCMSFGRVKVKLVIHAAPPAPVSIGPLIECAKNPVDTLNANTRIIPTAGSNLVWYDKTIGGTIVTNPTLNKADSTIVYYAENVDKLTKCVSFTRTAVTLSIISTTASASSNSPLSLGQTLLLKGGPEVPGNTYLWTDPSGLIMAQMDWSIPNVTAAAAGKYILSVTSLNGCIATDTIIVILDIAHAEAQGNVCIGSTLYLSGFPNNMRSYAWTGPNGFTSTDQNPAIPNVTTAKEGTYILVVTNQNNLTSSDSITVSFKPLPIPVAEYTTVCPAGMMQLNAGPNGMTSYLWTGPNGTTWPQQKPPAMAFPSPAANFTLTVVDWNGCEASKTITPIPFTPVATYNKPICSGDTLRLRGEPNGMANYKWSGPGGFVSSLQSPTLNNANAASSTGDYTLTVVDQAGCTFSSKVNVTFNPVAPVPTITANMNPICEGNTLSLDGGPAGMVSYNWTGPDGFSANIQNPQINSMAAINAGKYTLSITNPTGCKNSAELVISVISVNFNGTYGPFCISDSPVAMSVTPSGGTFTGPGVSGNTFDPKVAGVGSHLIQYTYSPPGVSCQITAIKYIDVVSVPKVVTNNPILSSCSGTTADLTNPTVTAGSTPGLIFTYWTDSKATAPIVTPKFVAAGTYFIKGSTLSGKCSDVQPVMVGQPDSLRANLTALTVLNCAHDTTGSLSVNITMGTAPFSYRWSTVPVQTTATATNLRSGIYTVVITDAKMCTAAFTGEIVEPAPIKLWFATKPIQCLSDANGSARVDSINGSGDVTLLNSYKYLWGTNPVQTTREAVRLTAWWHKVTLTSPKGCVQKDSVFIDVLDTIPPTIVCPKDIEMTVQYIKSLDGSPNKYTVDLGKPYTLDNCQVDTLTNDAPAKFRAGITVVVWTVTDQVGLSDTCHQNVFIKEIPTIPQLISPNGDGVNDTFVIDGLNSSDYQNSQMTIFTRSGQLVFQSSNYELPGNAWDGRYKESNFSKNSLVAPGVYYYILKLGGTGGQTLKGYIYVYY